MRPGGGGGGSPSAALEVGVAWGDDASTSAEEDASSWLLDVTVALVGDEDGGRRRVFRRDNSRMWERWLRRSSTAFKRRMRMHKVTFAALYDKVRPHLRRPGDGVVGRYSTVRPRIRLLLLLYWLAHGGEQQVMCHIADVAEATFSGILCALFAALNNGLPGLHFPSTETEQAAAASDFVVHFGARIAGVVGVTNGTLIRINSPPAAYKLGFNTRKCFYRVMLLAMVDAQKRFIGTRSGLRGSLADSRAFKETSWYDRQSSLGSRVLFPGAVILADGGFALGEWPLKLFPRNQLNEKRRFFNHCLSSTRAVAECAFGLLKGRWRILQGTVSSETELVPEIVDACVLLHNFMLAKKDNWGHTVDALAEGAHYVHPDVGVNESYRRAIRLRDNLVGALWVAHHESCAT